MLLSTLCGQLLVGGFDGTSLPAEVADDLRAGTLGGIILFRRNLGADIRDVRSITLAASEAAFEGLPPLVCVDQEGGRVARLGPPVVRLPAMAKLAATGDVDLIRHAGFTLGSDLRALGFSSGLSPVLDVHSNAENPIIGDRAFGTDAAAVSRLALALAEGLRKGGAMPCGKHFPGHGDTATDSHLELPVVRHDRARLLSVELAPFAAAAAAGIESLMTAHVSYPALDPEHPATLSRKIVTDLLRGELGYRGVVFSDDLEMRALSQDIETTAVAAIRAGCDSLLVCSRRDLLARARDALVRAAEADSTFRARCEEAFARFSVLRRRFPPRPLLEDGALEAHFAAPDRFVMEDV